ncbi:hypothetical protein BCR42DRAFT_453997 [Absidia repens]|uniref:Serine/threonine-protein phosphatase 4 regulatory subunit 3-like central domain-containing protein n=1 Tax=Absidia repens TaxID=90262 RepID=A0A1X2I9P7_9FUNG|nr:hypothetical protein BCR42DRAFT_453997 [Absidia repens]
MYLHTHQLPGHRSEELGILPSPELDTLLHYAKALSDTKQRDHIDLLVVTLLSNDHVGKLLAIFEQCAQQDDLSNMRTLRGIFNTMLLWADTDMIQELVLEKHIHGVLSVFDFMSKRNPSFCEQFESMPRLDLIDLLKKKTILVDNLRHAENLAFIKNQIAPQYWQKTSLVNALQRMCSWKHLAIVNWMQQDTLLIPQLFDLLLLPPSSSDDNNDLTHQKRSAVHFLSKMFEFALNDMQQFASASFFREMTKKGLLNVIQQLLCSDDRTIQITTTHLLSTTVQLDIWVLQQHILNQTEKQQQQHPSSSLLQVVLDQLAQVDDYVLKQQLFSIIKQILGLADLGSSSNYIHRQSIFNDDPVTGNMLKLFYERYASTLILPIHAIQATQQPPIDMDHALVPLEMDPQQIVFYDRLCEFLQSILLQYGTRTKRILQDPLCFQNVAQLLRCQDATLKLRTLGFFRAVVGLRDNDIHALMIQQNVFAYLVRLFLDTNPEQQHQQLYTELVELFDFIQLRNIVILMEHIVSEFGDLLEPFPIYQSIKTKYDKHLESRPPPSSLFTR